MGRSSSILYNLIFISIGLLYPAYCSIVALETKERADDVAWLMFWVVFALFSILEYFADFILSWFPLYPIFKLGFIAWCVAPIGQNGAYYLYKAFISPFIRMYGGHIDDILMHTVNHMKNAADYIPSYPK